MLLNCGVGEDSCASLGLQGDQTQSILKEISSEYSLEGLMLKRKSLAPDAKIWLIRKDCNAEKYWRQEEKGMTEDKRVGWHHWLNGHEFEQALGDGLGQGILACYSPWGCKESDTTEELRSSERLEDTKHIMRGGTDETTFDSQNFNPLLPLDSLNDNNQFYIPRHKTGECPHL